MFLFVCFVFFLLWILIFLSFFMLIGILRLKVLLLMFICFLLFKRVFKIEIFKVMVMFKFLGVKLEKLKLEKFCEFWENFCEKLLFLKIEFKILFKFLLGLWFLVKLLKFCLLNMLLLNWLYWWCFSLLFKIL